MSHQSPRLGHGSTRSRAAGPRFPTEDPIDPGEIPIRDSTSSPAPLPSSTVMSPDSLHPRTPPHLRRPGRPTVPTSLPKDFSFLLRPEIYHPLTALNTPPPFRSSPKQPDPSVPIPELLSRGHFRAAAIAAVQELTGTSADPTKPPVDPADSDLIFSLLYTRLACLTLVGATSLAAQEVRAFEDLNNAARYVDQTSGDHLVPWELRVLNVRLQALGFGDPRRAVTSYYDLSREAREQISRAGARGNREEADAWKARLHDLGVRVADALIEMDDLAGAAHHLASLNDRGDGKLALSKALLWLHMGDPDSAAACIAGAGRKHAGRVVAALCDMANGAYDAALGKWRGLQGEVPDEMVGVNTAVCLLYLGRMDEGRKLLEGLVDAGCSSHTLLFNLSTMYELCTERNRDLKLTLAEKVANMDEGPVGWERTGADFKM